jgi:hypothetical protein
MIENRLAEWRRLLRSSTTQARAVIQRIVRGRIVFTPVPDSVGYTFEAETRYDKLFSGLVVPRAVWAHPPGRGTETIRPEDVSWTDPGAEYDYGALLEQAANRVKCMASPAGFEPAFWP